MGLNTSFGVWMKAGQSMDELPTEVALALDSIRCNPIMTAEEWHTISQAWDEIILKLLDADPKFALPTGRG